MTTHPSLRFLPTPLLCHPRNNVASPNTPPNGRRHPKRQVDGRRPTTPLQANAPPNAPPNAQPDAPTTVLNWKRSMKRTMIRLVWHYVLFHLMPMNKKWCSNLSPTLRETHRLHHWTCQIFVPSPFQRRIERLLHFLVGSSMDFQDKLPSVKIRFTKLSLPVSRKLVPLPPIEFKSTSIK